MAPLDSALDLSIELDWAVLLGTAGRAPAKPDGVVRVLCACGRVSDVSRKSNVCVDALPRATAQTPDSEVSAARAAPSWRCRRSHIQLQMRQRAQSTEGERPSVVNNVRTALPNLLSY